MSQLLTHKRNKQSLVELLMGPSRDHLSHTGLQFVVVGHFIMYRSTYDETTNNQEEADTLTHLIISSKIDGNVASDVDLEVLLIAHRSLLSCGNVYFGDNAEKTNIGSPSEFLGKERTKCLLTLHCLTACDTVKQFNNASKES